MTWVKFDVSYNKVQQPNFTHFGYRENFFPRLSRPEHEADHSPLVLFKETRVLTFRFANCALTTTVIDFALTTTVTDCALTTSPLLTVLHAEAPTALSIQNLRCGIDGRRFDSGSGTHPTTYSIGTAITSPGSREAAA